MQESLLEGKRLQAGLRESPPCVPSSRELLGRPGGVGWRHGRGQATQRTLSVSFNGARGVPAAQPGGSSLKRTLGKGV